MRVTVERSEGTPRTGRTVKRWAFYAMQHGNGIRVVLDNYVRGTIAPGKRKVEVEIGYDRLNYSRRYIGAMRLDRDLVHIPDDVREEALGLVRSFIRFAED